MAATEERVSHKKVQAVQGINWDTARGHLLFFTYGLRKLQISPPVHVWRRRQWHPTPALLPGKSHGRRSLEGRSPWGRKESDKTQRLHFHALEKEMATHSSVLAWRIPGTGEPRGLQSMGSHRVGHDWSDLAAAAAAPAPRRHSLRPLVLCVSSPHCVHLISRHSPSLTCKRG